MDVLVSALEILMRWDVILALLVGSVGGVVIGAIPGVGPAVAIAILLPATFSMDPIVGLTTLLVFTDRQCTAARSQRSSSIHQEQQSMH